MNYSKFTISLLVTVLFLIVTLSASAGQAKLDSLLNKIPQLKKNANVHIFKVNLDKKALKGKKTAAAARSTTPMDENGAPFRRAVVPVSLVLNEVGAGGALFLTNTDFDSQLVQIRLRFFEGTEVGFAEFVLPPKAIGIIPLIDECTNDCTSMSGKVHAPGNASAAGAVVRVHIKNDDGTMGDLIRERLVDDHEEYGFSCLPHGEFYVYARKEGFRDSQIHSIISNGRHINLNLTLRPEQGGDDDYSDDPSYDDSVQNDFGSDNCEPIVFLGQIEISTRELLGDTDQEQTDKVIATMYQWFAGQIMVTPVENFIGQQ